MDDSSRTLLQVAGIDLNGRLYDSNALPGDPAGSVTAIEGTLNDTLRQLAVQASGEYYTLSEIIIDNTTLILILR